MAKNKKSSATGPMFALDGDVLVIRIPISPRPSSTGKTTVIASTRGNKATGMMFDDNGEEKEIICGVNAYVYAD